MVTDDATRGGAEGTMVTSKMTGNAPYQGALDAAFSVGGGCDCEKRKCGQRAREGLGHVVLQGHVGWSENPGANQKFLRCGRGERQPTFPTRFPTELRKTRWELTAPDERRSAEIAYYSIRRKTRRYGAGWLSTV
jgi:hypothetical protein